MRQLILEGRTIFDDQGGQQGPLQLEEGQKAGPFVILESCSAPLKVVTPTDSELKETKLVGSKPEKHLLTLEGRFQMADTVNANGRIYPESIWKKVFENRDLVGSLDRGEMLGEADHPKDGETRLSRVAGKVTKLWRNPNNLKEIMGRFTVFDNEAGRNLKAIHEGGGRLGVSSRGKGSVVRMNGNDVVQEDYNLQTWDVVHGPSTPGAYPEEVTESKVDDLVYEVMQEALGDVKDPEKRKKQRYWSGYQIGTVDKKRGQIKKPGSLDNVSKGKLGDDWMQGYDDGYEGKPSVVKSPLEFLEAAEPIMEPGFVKTAGDEEKWSKAKDAAGKKGGETKWALANYIFHKMKGKKDESLEENHMLLSLMAADVGHLLDKGPADWDAIRAAVEAAVPDSMLRQFLEVLVKAGKLKLQSGKYMKESLKETKVKPKNANEVKEAVRLLDVDPSTDIQESLKSIRAAYRKAFSVEGPFEKHEIAGLNEAARDLVEKAVKLNETSPVIKVWLGNVSQADAQEVYEVRSEAELRAKVKSLLEASKEPVVVNVDRSEAIYADCARRFSGLLEAQTLKAEKSVQQKAQATAALTEMSAKGALAKRLIEGFAVRCRELTEQRDGALADLDAACRILEEMPKEVKAEGIRGAVAALAASGASKVLGEKLVSVGSIEEAVGLARQVVKDNLPKIVLEPTHEEQVAEAVKASEKVEKKLVEKKSPVDPETRRQRELTEALVARSRQRGGK